MRPLTIYDYDVRIAECFDEETGEIFDPEKLTQLYEEKDQLIENLALFALDLDAQARAKRDIASKYTEMARELETRAENARISLQKALMGEKFKSDKVSCSYHHSKSAKIEPGALLPDEFMRFKEPEYNKSAILKALKDGIQLEGCTLIETESLVIK